MHVFRKAPDRNKQDDGLVIAPPPELEKKIRTVRVKTIRALWRGVHAARAQHFATAVDWFNIAHDCAVWRRRRTLWNLDAALRFIIPACRASRREPTLEAVLEMEALLLSKADQPDHSRRLFDRLWTTWCMRAYRSEGLWTYQTAEK